jgi:hypothetical protein
MKKAEISHSALESLYINCFGSLSLKKHLPDMVKENKEKAC